MSGLSSARVECICKCTCGALSSSSSLSSSPLVAEDTPDTKVSLLHLRSHAPSTSTKINKQQQPQQQQESKPQNKKTTETKKKKKKEEDEEEDDEEEDDDLHDSAKDALSADDLEFQLNSRTTMINARHPYTQRHLGELQSHDYNFKLTDLLFEDTTRAAHYCVDLKLLEDKFEYWNKQVEYASGNFEISMSAGITRALRLRREVEIIILKYRMRVAKWAQFIYPLSEKHALTINRPAIEATNRLQNITQLLNRYDSTIIPVETATREEAEKIWKKERNILMTYTRAERTRRLNKHDFSKLLADKKKKKEKEEHESLPEKLNAALNHRVLRMTPSMFYNRFAEKKKHLDEQAKSATEHTSDQPIITPASLAKLEPPPPPPLSQSSHSSHPPSPSSSSRLPNSSRIPDMHSSTFQELATANTHVTKSAKSVPQKEQEEQEERFKRQRRHTEEHFAKFKE